MSPFARLALLLAGALSVTALTTPLKSKRYWDDDLLSCESLETACNGNTTDLNNVYSNPACVVYMSCVPSFYNVDDWLVNINAPKDQPRLTENVFKTFTGGNDVMTQQNYIDAYYGLVASTPNATYPDNAGQVIAWWQRIVAWTGFCSNSAIPYSNFADWFEYSSTPGVCPAVASCNATIAATAPPCVPQPITDNGSCAEMVGQCSLFVRDGLFQSEVCVMASFCYAESTTDVLLNNIYPYYWTDIPTTSEEARLSQELFYNMTGGAETMSEQNAIDAYYSSLTNTWTTMGGPFGGQDAYRSGENGPYPTSVEYVQNFWSIISAWTGFCDTKEIPYSNLADYLSYAATSNYHPTC